MLLYILIILECDSRYCDSSTSQNHLRFHTKEDVVACSKCGTSFNSVNTFLDHVQRQSTNPSKFIFGKTYSFFSIIVEITPFTKLQILANLVML